MAWSLLDFRNELAYRLNDLSNVHYPAGELNSYIKQSETRVALDSACLDLSAVKGLIAGTQSYAMSAEGFWKVDYVTLSKSSGDIPLVKMSLANFAQNPSPSTQSDPVVWTEHNGYILLSYIPASADSIKVWGKKLPASTNFSADSCLTEIPYEYYESMLLWSKMLCVQRNNDSSKSSELYGIYQREIKRLTSIEMNRNDDDGAWTMGFGGSNQRINGFTVFNGYK